MPSKMTRIKCPLYKRSYNARIFCENDKKLCYGFASEEIFNKHREVFCKTMLYKQCSNYINLTEEE